MRAIAILSLVMLAALPLAALLASSGDASVECYTASELDWALRFALEGNR